MMKSIWYLISFSTLFFILINNPKSSTLSVFGDQGKTLNFTREAQKKLQIITTINVCLFFIITIFFVISFSL